MIKRTFALLMILILCLPVCAFSEKSDGFFTELGNFLLYVDRLLEDELFAINYVEKFNETRTQDDLLISRVAVQSSLKEIESMSLPETSMTDDEYFSYMLDGVEVEALSLLIDEVKIFRDEKVNVLKNIYETMLSDVYFEPALDNQMEEIALHKIDIMLDARDYVCMTNYLLLQLKDSESVYEFWNYLKENTCVLKTEMDTFHEDPERLVGLVGDNLDQMAANINKIEELDGFNEFFYKITVEAAQTGDLSVFKNNRTEIIGETQVFPMPEWSLASEMEHTYIFSDPETGNLYVHTMGNEITSAPDRIKITAEGITIDDMQIYLDSLYYLEYNPVYEFVTEDGIVNLYLMAEKGESSLMVIWNENETVLYLMPPAASLVPYMYWK